MHQLDLLADYHEAIQNLMHSEWFYTKFKIQVKKECSDMFSTLCDVCHSPDESSGS